MAAETTTPPLPEQMDAFPEVVKDWMVQKGAGMAKSDHIDSVLAGTEWKAARERLMSDGVATYESDNGEPRVLVADLTKDGHVLNIAAAIPRNAGKSFDFLNQLEDFQDVQTGTKQSRKDAIVLFHKVARAEGAVANAISKMAALVAVEGKFKVMSVRGERGRGNQQTLDDAERILNWWKDNVNTRAEDSVITGERGIKSFILQGARLLFIEGDHIARGVWTKKSTMIPQQARAVTLPMNLQTFSAQHIEIAEGLEGTNIELLYWVPPAKLIQTLDSGRDPNVTKILTKILGTKVISELRANRKYLLDPALLLHIKHRGLGIEPFGQSLIEPALSDIRYKRALDSQEIVTITNLMNRQVIQKVGDPNPDSAYHKQEVSRSRLAMLQRLMQTVGPSATILWGGHDIDKVEISAHESILELDGRYKIAERRILMALGVPAVLLLGEGGDGKAVANAASLAMVAQQKEVQEQYAQALRTYGERILADNGFLDVEVVWEWSDDLLDDKQAAAEMILKLFQVGLFDTQTAIEGLGLNYPAIEKRMASDVEKGYRDEAFGAPKSANTTNPAGMGGETGGRPTRDENPQRDPREGRESGATE